FIGANLADGLLARGAEVRVFDNLPTGFRDNVPVDAELLEGDIRDEAAVRAAMVAVDVVFHQAANRAVLQSVQDPLSTDLANTHGTLLVLKPAQDAGVRRVVAASSSSVSADLTAAGRDLGWQPTVGLADGLHRTVDWFAGPAL
ncbi:MAG: NAD-dependent epimerase/dehydratase family protein, partial [Actinobacteria bacterium]|nr:NAD-dependent epimerase/dehydratase family protein [Actinomycetota bacterium]